MEDEPTQENGHTHPAKRAEEHHRKHLALWISVGGVMAFIAVLWLKILPFQLKDGKVGGFSEMKRWYSVRLEDEPEAKSFFESLDELGARLNAVEKDQRERLRVDQPKSTSSAASGEIDVLRTKIEAASKKNEMAPSDANTNAETPKQP